MQADEFFDAMRIRQITFQTFDDKDKRKLKALGRILHGSHLEVTEALKTLNRRGAGIYFMVNEGNGFGRSTECVTGIRFYFADLDGTPLLEEYPLEPSAIISTSPGRYHLYWRLDHAPKESFTHYQTKLADLLGSCHKVIDLPRVLRVPGYFHMKQDPVKVEILSLNDNRYTHDEFVDTFSLERFAQKKPVPPLPPIVKSYLDKRRGIVKGDISGNVYKVSHAPNGERNKTLYTHACAIRRDVEQGLVPEDVAFEELCNAGVISGLTFNEAQATIRSAWRQRNAN